MKTRILILLLIGCLFSIKEATATQHYDDIPNFNPTNTYHFDFYDGPTVSDGKVGGLPYYTIKILGYNDYGQDDYMNYFKLSYRLDGETAWTDLVTEKENSLVWRLPKGSIHGAVEDWSTWEDGSPGFRHTFNYIRWYIPERVTGKRIHLKIDYQWTWDRDNQSMQKHEFTRDVPSINEPVVTCERQGVSDVVLNWKGASLQGNVQLTLNGKIKSEQPAKATGLYTFENIKLTDTDTIGWKFCHTVNSHGGDKLNYIREGAKIFLAMTKLEGFTSKLDLCSKTVKLNWRNPNPNDGVVYLLRRVGTNGAITKLSTFYGDEFEYEDINLALDQTFTYILAKLPEGINWEQYTKYNLFLENQVKTDAPIISIPDLTLTEIPQGNDITYLKLYWKRSNWCPDAIVKLIKKTKAVNRTQEILLDTEQTEYLDEETIGCATYEYSIQVTNLGRTLNGKSKTYAIDQGSVMKALKATKGVYNNKVELEWEASNPLIVGEYKIYRKLLSDPDTKYELKGTIKNNSSVVTWRDEMAVAGQYYSYKVESVTTCGEGKTVYSSKEDIGFMQSYGTLAGQISYKGGTNVAEVAVRLQRMDNGKLTMANRSIYLNGNAYAIASFKDGIHTCVKDGFSFQAYIRPEEQLKEGNNRVIAELSGEFKLSLEGVNLVVKVGDATLVYPFGNRVTKYTQITVTAQNDIVILYIDGKKVKESAISHLACGEATDFNLGTDALKSNGFVGYIDEVRLWKRALSETEVESNYCRYLQGTEDGLSAYWQFDEGLDTHFFDLAHKDYTFYENNGILSGARSTEIIPEENQLALMAYTDKNGNYIIRGIPYGLEGTTYAVVPSYQVHQFEPAQQIRHIGGGGLSVINSIDFSDISSFKVSGTVEFKETNFPVEGASIYVDGALATSDGEMVTTNREGRFTLDVPIGEHFIQIKMDNHIFTNKGRWPVETTAKYFDFQHDVSGLMFEDETLVKVAGRVTGGRVESGKPIGFGLSENNLGTGIVQFQPEKEEFSLIENGNRTQDVKDKYITNSVTIYDKSIQIIPNKVTGEFVAYLPPLKYVVKQVTAGNYVIPSEQLTSLNLTQWEDKEEIQDVKLTIDGKEIIKKDTFSYNTLCKYTYTESTPVLVVSQMGAKSSQLFGDSVYYYKQKTKVPLYVVKKIKDEITGEIADSVGYTFDYPIFSQLQKYRYRIEAWEEYKNIDNESKIYRLPFVDGKLRINNSFAIMKETIDEPSSVTGGELVELSLDSTGVTTYVFQGGLPNISINENNPDDNFKRSMRINIVTNAGRSIPWPSEAAMTGYLLGAMATGNNFVTSGPDQLLTVLRDPPGSNSFTSMEKGSTFTKSSSSSLSSSSSQGGQVNVHLGVKMEFESGVPGASVSQEFEVINDLSSGQTATSTYSSDSTRTTTYSNSQVISTSADPAYVGAMGDVFIGMSTNIVYGAAESIEIAPESELDEETFARDGFAIGKKQSIRANVGGKTFFTYDQNHIVNYLIPNLKMLRNKILAYQPDANFVPSDTINNSYYLTTLTPEDKGFASDNDNLDFWYADYEFWYGNNTPSKADSAKFDMQKYRGSSYRRYPIAGTDSVRYYNQQIDLWEYYLAANEQAKINAKEKIKNHSFSAGVGEVTESTQNCNSLELNYSYDFEADIMFTEETDITMAGLGGGFSMEMHEVTNKGNGTGESTETCTTFSYTLADGDQGDYQSVDVYEGETMNNSPIFKRVAGQTACPYEGELVSSYYRPGTSIDKATQRIEVPKISVKDAIVSGVAGGRDAVFELYLQNESEVGADVTYSLQVDDSTNPNGAILMIDGSTLTADGRSFTVPAGGTLTKTLIVRQSRTDILNYENLRLILASGCQYDPTDDVDDVFDDVTVSAYFQPSSSPLALALEGNINVINSVTGTTLNLDLKDYDCNYKNFAGIALEYRAESDANWTTQAYFANSKEEYDRTSGEKALIDGPVIKYAWDMSSLVDRRYQLRARSISKTATGAFIAENALDPISITKDISSPKQMGNPSPADGILLPGSDILVNFNENIQKNMVTRYNIHINGELNGQSVSNGVGLEFTGNKNFAYTEAPLDLAQKSFSIEFWMKRTLGESGVVYSQGNNENGLNIGFDEQNYLHVTYNNQDIRSKVAIPEKGWMHIAVTYSLDTRKLSAYVSAQNVAEKDRKVIDGQHMGENPLALSGKVNLGKSVCGNASYLTKGFKGAINELRIWNKERTMIEIQTQSNLTLSGREIGLIGYWPMNEAEGTFAKDKVASHHLAMNTGWYVYPKGYAVQFNGVDQALKLNTKSVILTKDNNYTIEFWFKAGDNKNTAMYAYNQTYPNATGKDSVVNVLSIGMDADGLLSLYNQKEKYTLSQKLFADNQWHCFVLSLNRASKAQVYIDNEIVFSTLADKFPALAGGNTWIGAYSKDSAFFKGTIDELRVWSSALTADQLERDANIRQKGDETGLRAYYPFDAYISDQAGYSSLQASLEDQINQKDIIPGGAAVVIGTSPLTDAAMNIREARQMTNIDMFDYTVSDNSILITLTENKERIEGCVLDFTIDGVQDLFGNKQTSPVKWSALVNQNTLKWSEVEVSKEKKLFDPLQFMLNVVNNRGTKDNFILENLPSWLSVSESSGVLQPMESRKITFRVNESLNIGSYNEVIYLKGSSNLTSLLKLSVKVRGEKPNWSVNPADFDYSMNMVGSLAIEGILSSDTEDMVAAFSNGQCIGVATPQYVPSHDFYALFMTVYNNKSTDKDVTFRVWDASKGRIYPTVEPRTFVFESDKVEGTFENPVKLNAIDEIQLDWNLHKGWNWVSLNVKSEHLNQPAILLDTLKQSIIALKGFDNEIRYDSQYGWYGTLDEFNVTQAYKAQMKTADTLNLVGRMTTPSIERISLKKGWNWIGFIPNDVMTVNEALSNLSAENGDVIKNQTDFAMFYSVNGGWMGSLKYMKPGVGYMYSSTSSKAFTYPSFSTNTAQHAPEKNEAGASAHWQMDESGYASNMNIVSEVYFNEELTNTSRFAIGAFAGDECRGIAKVAGDKYFITIHADKAGEKISFKAMDITSGEMCHVAETILFADQVLGDLVHPYALHLTSATGISKQESAFVIYPNPVKDKLYVRGMPDNVRDIRITDATGRVVILVENLRNEEGIDVTSLTEGTYILVVDAGTGIYREKFVKSNTVKK